MDTEKIKVILSAIKNKSLSRAAEEGVPALTLEPEISRGSALPTSTAITRR